MAWTLSAPSPLTLPISSTDRTTLTADTVKCHSAWRSNSERNRATRIIINASQGETNSDDSDNDSPAFNPFGFVTDNPSSRSAIQLPESPAEDGNVGQMLYVSGQFFISFPWVANLFIGWIDWDEINCFCIIQL